eukprot:CAMPEP_0179156314 /NCGR_PEP_ID=MMETSP0796-20121207/76197_1 /TAXON_ID=73915 /ORGANISM="Pyrodinium bahamense, Strain pbaha01" /LENGTH=490 /DNA_ID=CAMNT_0020857883 /DNA_START=25 /DNA_END=1495 /DNA_ORIENTATION=-
MHCLIHGRRSDAHHLYVLVPPPIALKAGPVLVVVNACAVPLALHVLALEPLAVGAAVRALAVHAVLDEAAPVAVARGVEVGAHTVFLAIDKLSLIAVPVRVVEGAPAMPLAVLEFAFVSAAKERAVGGAVAVPLLAVRAAAAPLVGIAPEGPEPLVGGAAAVALQLGELLQLHLEFCHIAIDPEVDDEVHVPADARVHEAILDALHHEVGAATAQAQLLQHCCRAIGIAAQVLQGLRCLLNLREAADSDARAVDICAMSEVVLRELIGEALDGLPPHAQRPFDTPLDPVRRHAHAAGEAEGEGVQQLQARRPGSVRQAHGGGLLRLQRCCLQLFSCGQGPEALEGPDPLELSLRQAPERLLVRSCLLGHAIGDPRSQFPVGWQRCPGKAAMLQREVRVQVLPMPEDVTVHVPDFLDPLAVVLPHGIHRTEAPALPCPVAVQLATVLARDDGFALSEPLLAAATYSSNSAGKYAREDQPSRDALQPMGAKP